MKILPRYISLCLAALFSLGITGYSFVRMKSVRAYTPDAADQIMFRALQTDRIGNRPEAIALTEKAAAILLTRDRTAVTRHSLILCAMDLSRYGQRQAAVSLLRLVNGYSDGSGKLARRTYHEIAQNDRRWRTLPRPNPEAIQYRKAILKKHPNAVL